MAVIRPFKAVRPPRDKAHLLVSRPFYTYKKNVLKAKLESNPFTFMHIINPEFDKKHKSEPNSRERFMAVKEKYQNFLDKKYLVEEDTPTIYLYRQSKNEMSFTGIIAAASVDDYLNDVIKKHEDTLTSRVKVFSDYLDVVKFNAEPVLLSYPKNEKVVSIYNQILSERPEYEFTTADEVKHELWLVQHPKVIGELQNIYAQIDHLYIADGHHRSSSSALHAERLRNEGASREKTDDFLAYIIDDSQLKIWEFNRLVKDFGGMDSEIFLEDLKADFEVDEIKKAETPKHKYQFTLYLDKKWFMLTLKEKNRKFKSIQASIDAQVLTDFVLEPLLQISDLKTDERIAFLSGEEGIKGIKKSVDGGKFKAGFILFPVSFDEIKSISDAGATMPPKSTWIEPKLRSGMTILKV